MSNQAKEHSVAQTDTPATLTVDQMAKMLLQTQTQLAEAQQKLAEAILEARKPYVDPRVLEEKRRQLVEKREQIEREQKMRENTKKICPHKRENGTWNIKWMEHSNGIILGVCGRCFSQFDASRNTEDRAILRDDLKAIKNMGRAGSHARRGQVVEL